MIYSSLALTIPFIILAALNSLVSILSRKSFGRCMPLTMMACMVVLFSSQAILHSFIPGILLILIGAVLVFPAIVHKTGRNRRSILFPGLMVFAGIGIVVFIWDY